MRIVSWNMNHSWRSDKQRKQAWDYLREELKADLALVQEAVPPPNVECVYRAIDETDPHYNWGSAVVSLHPDITPRARKRIPLDRCTNMRAPTADELLDSHPGACAVADIVDAKHHVRLTAISLYGQWEMRGDACTHVRTLRANNRPNSGPTQFDYAFVSERLLPKLKCRVVNDDQAAWALSDHCPVLVEIEC